MTLTELTLPQITAVGFGLLGVVAVWPVVRYIFSSDDYRRLLVSKLERNLIRTHAGEMNPTFYRKMLKNLKRRKNLKMEIVAGPWMLVENDDWDKYFDDNTMKIKDARNYLDIHPVFRLLKSNPEKISVWIKKEPLPNERHFCVGTESKSVYVELYHGRGPARGGDYFNNDPEISDAKQREFRVLRDDGSKCEKLTKENFTEILSGETIGFCPLKWRPLSAEQSVAERRATLCVEN